MAETVEKKDDEMPEAEVEEEKDKKVEEQKGGGGDDEKKESEAKKPVRIPKEDPGDGLPKEDPAKIEFKWNKEMKDKKSCDTQHMLYLLQLALNLVRLRTIERNKYFKSIGRTDRYINQLDNPQIITNFLDWHNKDKENNKFDGNLLDKSEKLFMINNIISEIGQVKKGPATKIYTKLKKDVVIETTTWLELPQPKLKLETWGYTKMYKGEKIIDECSVDEIITLLTYVNPSAEAWAQESKEEEKGGDKPILRGVFQSVKWSNNFKTRVDPKSGKKKNPKPSALETDILINGKEKAIKKSEYDKFSNDDCTKEYIESFENKAKQIGRWETLIVNFFRGTPRKYEYADGKVDIPVTNDPKEKATPSPKELEEAGNVKPSKYEGPYNGAKFINTSVKEVCQQCMNYLIHEDIKNQKGKPFNTKLRGGVNQILRELKKCYVNGILQAAKQQQPEQK